MKKLRMKPNSIDGAIVYTASFYLCVGMLFFLENAMHNGASWLKPMAITLAVLLFGIPSLGVLVTFVRWVKKSFTVKE